MQFEDVIENRRSIRKYKDRPVAKEKIIKILDAARIAPSAGHRQPWHFIVVEKKSTIEKLAGNQSWAATAPFMIVGLADPVTSPSWCINDFGIAFEHIVLAATNLGLGTCWMGQTRREAEVKKLLDIPSEYKVIALTPIGEPDEMPSIKTRKSLDTIVSWEKFGSNTQ